MSTTSIYILRLEGGNYYVGKTDNIYKRYEEHLKGAGSAWTRKHAPLSLVKTVESASPFDEDKITKEYMATYGIDKVRGGSYVSVELSAVQKQSINAEIRGAKDLCTQCGKGGHFVKDCYTTSRASPLRRQATTYYNSKMFYDSDSDDSDSDSDDSDSDADVRKTYRTKTSVCYRCGRDGHYSPKCYASTHVKGYKL